MSREDAHKLLGGYATGTLTAEEQQALFEAALQDQELFDALAREQALREVLDDPAARAQLLAAIDDLPAPWYRRLWRPLPMAALATGLASIAIVAVLLNPQKPAPLPVAKVELPPIPKAEEAPAPVLPAPPETKQTARSSMAPLNLPGLVPTAPPPPPVAVTESKAVAPRAETMANSLNGVLPTFVPPPVRQGFRDTMPVFGVPVGQTTRLRGTVTNSVGDPIRSASVEMTKASTGEVTRVSTNDRGEFSAPGEAGQQYVISASAAGFGTAKATVVPPAPGPADPVNLKLQAGDVSVSADAVGTVDGVYGGRGGSRAVAGARAETKKAAPMVMPQAAVPAPPPAPAAAPMQAPQMQAEERQVMSATGRLSSQHPKPLRLEYRVMRRMPDRSQAEVPAGGSVPVNASLILRVTPSADGYVRITRPDGRTLDTRRVRGGQPFETALPKFGKAGPVELQAAFSRRPFPTSDSAAKDIDQLTMIIRLNVQ